MVESGMHSSSPLTLRCSPSLYPAVGKGEQGSNSSADPRITTRDLGSNGLCPQEDSHTCTLGKLC